MNYDYWLYLRSDWWKGRREQALEDVDYTCQICGSQIELQVHHLNYENLWEEKDRDLLVACEVCHKKHHEGYPFMGSSTLFKKRFDECSVAMSKTGK